MSYLFDNKSVFNEKISSYLNRDTTDIEKINEKEFSEFIKKHNPIFFKSYNGDFGRRIERFDKKRF